MVSDPWQGVKTIYWVDHNGIYGAVGEFVREFAKWDWLIEIFLGTIWNETQNFDEFVKKLQSVWLHEYLHMLIRWEKVYDGVQFDEDEEVVVRALERLLME